MENSYSLTSCLSSVLVCFGFGLVLLFQSSGVLAAPWWSKSINVESKVGTDRSIQSLDVMYPISHSESSLLFTDLRGRIDDDQSVEVNLGLAHRFVASNPLDGLVPGVDSSGEAVFGYYGFADRLESEFDNTFYQATAGFEYFTKDYSLRVNGYLPEDDREPTEVRPDVRTTRSNLIVEERLHYEQPLPGYDLEFGRTVRFDGWQFYGRGSYFRFQKSGVPEVEGTRLRSGVQFDGSHPEVYLPEGSQLTIGMEWQSDKVRHDQTFGIARMRIPFGSSVESRGSRVQSQKTPENSDSRPTTPDSGLTTDSRLPTQDFRLSAWQKDRLTERISRDVDVVAAESSSSDLVDTGPAVLATTGDTLGTIGVAKAGASGTGRIDEPGSLASAVDRAGTDGTVFVLGSGGTVPTSGVTIPGGQYVIGGGADIVLQQPDGTGRLTYSMGDQRAVIRGTASKPILQLRKGTGGQLVRKVTLNGGSYGIRGQNLRNVTIQSVTVEEPDNTGIGLSNARDVSIQNVLVKNAGSNGIYLDTPKSRNVELKDITVIGAVHGVRLTADTLTARNLTVRSFEGDGIRFSGTNHDVTNLSVLGTGTGTGDGIILDADRTRARSLSVENTRLGLIVAGSNVEISEVNLSNVRRGVSVTGDTGGKLVFDGVDLRNVADDAVYLDVNSTKIKKLDLGEDFHVSGSSELNNVIQIETVKTVNSDDRSGTVATLRGTINAPGTDCSIENNVTIGESSLVLDAGSTRKTVSQANCAPVP